MLLSEYSLPRGVRVIREAWVSFCRRAVREPRKTVGAPAEQGLVGGGIRGRAPIGFGQFLDTMASR